jgi:hypothetical protein
MKNNVVFMVSYRKNVNNKRIWNEISNITKKNFVNNGFKVKMVEGYNIKEYPEIKKNKLVYLNFINKAIIKGEKYLKNNNDDGFFIAEDDAWINLSFDNLKQTIKLSPNTPLIRVGYQKILKENLPRGYYCVGTQLVWIPRNMIEQIKKIMTINKAQHLDGFLSKNLELDIVLAEKGLVSECSHISLTLNNYRNGKNCSNK